MTGLQFLNSSNSLRLGYEVEELVMYLGWLDWKAYLL